MVGKASRRLLTLFVVLFSAGVAAGQQLTETPPAQTEVSTTKEEESFLLTHSDTDEGSAARPSAPLAFWDGCGADTRPDAPVSLDVTATDRNTGLATKCTSAAAGLSTTAKLKFSFAPVSPCDGLLKIGFTTACFTQPVLRFNLWNSHVRAADESAMLLAKLPREKFHTGAALLQSLEFLVLEHAFRLANDPYARYLVVHKPFWHDYFSSASHFDMTRWGDGDDFLVNYIGHPLEGSVSGNIFIQNDPRGRVAKFGKSADYWRSRFEAMAWAAVYSAYFEIGPVLSETALGSEGGYTYIPHCGFYPSCHKEPGKSYKPPTNNTGWVDFVVTPVIGTGWMILEDFIEAEIVDKLANGSPSLKFKVLRGALAPSRTMSNFLAGRLPWYRPGNSADVAAAFGSPLQQALTRPAWKDDPRWGLGVQLTSASFPMDWEACNGCRVFTPGVGLNVGYRLMKYAYLDSEFNIFPGSPGRYETAVEGLIGVKVGRTSRSWGVFTQLRPGFIHYDKTLVPETLNDYESTTRFAFDVGANVEYYVSRHSTVRFNVGTTFVKYLTGRADPKQPTTSVLSDDFYAMHGSIRVTSGYMFRF